MTGGGLAHGGERLRAVWRLLFRTISQTQIAYRQSPLSSGRAGRIVAGDRLPWFAKADGDNHEVLDAYWQVQVYGNVVDDSPSDLRVVHFGFGPGARAAGFTEGAAYLVRPDGHIAAISTGSEAVAQVTARYRQFFDSKPTRSGDPG